MGERIKVLREGKDLSQEALGKLVGVNRAAVNKWETGQVENLKRSTIKKLADIFGVSPCFLMCFEEDTKATDQEIQQFEEKYNANASLAKEISLIEQIQQQYGKDAVQLLKCFSELNALGKEKAIENICDLAELPKYTEKEKTKLKNA